MDQFALHILGNNNSTSIEFIEKQYKLDAGETLVGKDNDFPEKKSIGDIITFYDGWKSDNIPLSSSEEDIITKPTASARFAIEDFLLGSFPVGSNENQTDKGITVEIELFFYMNHWLHITDPMEKDYHYSLTANKLIRFSVLKENINQYFYISAVQCLSSSGEWVEYGFDSGRPYASILASGSLSNTAFGVTVTASTRYITVTIANNLRDHSGFEDWIDYKTRVTGKIRAYQYDNFGADHDYEITSRE